MLFKIGDMLIIADSTECAREIFQRESKSQLTLPVQILIDEGETYTYINTDLTKIADINSLVKGCIENINNRYKDSLISVKSIFVKEKKFDENKNKIKKIICLMSIDF